MTLGLRFAARSHPGLLRDGNEDSVYAGPRLLAVADGMGGHAAGEVASSVAIAALAPLDEDSPGPDLLDALRQGAVSANTHLRDMVTGDPGLEGMGTTVTALLADNGRLGLLHIGDSRCYLLRDGQLAQITHDHTLVQSLVDEGRITEEEAGTHPQRSWITRALDGRDGLEMDLSVREARPGDRYLVCSDGLTGPVASMEALQSALEIPDPQQACDRLVELALKGGGPDNITVIVADVVEEDGPGEQPVIAGAVADAPQPVPASMQASPAARAAATRERPELPRRDEPVGQSGRSGFRLAALVLAVLAVLGAGTAATWAYVNRQWYVGVDDDGHVAVFRGVSGSVAGVSLSKVEERTPVQRDALDEVAQAQVDDGIPAGDRADAQRIVERLVAAVCPPPPVARPTATPVPRTTPTSLPSVAPGASVEPTVPDAAELAMCQGR